MIIRICFFTECGEKLAGRIIDSWKNSELAKSSENNEKTQWDDLIPQIRLKEDNLKEWTAESFKRRLPIVFIGACGIAVRTIAPFIEDKLQDSPVVVIDEQGRFVIPILSGHMGGANELALKISGLIGAEPVITTATDVEGLFSVDVFARENGLCIKNRNGIKLVSSKLLRGETVTVAIEEGIEFPLNLPQGLNIVSYQNEYVDIRIQINSELNLNQGILLSVKEYVLGMGCKRGKSFDELLEFVNNNSPVSVADYVASMASIDIKSKEEGLVNLAQYFHLDFETYGAEALNEAKGDFSVSEFVQSVTGVSNVCERAAVCGARGGELVVKKIAKDGMTLAIAKRKPKIITWET